MSLWDGEFTPAPARSLFANGKWCVPENERPADWRERMQPIACPPEKRQKMPMPGAFHKPPTRRVERPAVEPQPSYVKPPINGRPDAAHVIRAEERRVAVIALHAKGLDDAAIAKQMGISQSRVGHYLYGQRTIFRRKCGVELTEGMLLPGDTMRVVRELPKRHECRVIEAACITCGTLKTGQLSHFMRGYKTMCSKCPRTLRRSTAKDQSVMVRMKLEGATDVAIAAVVEMSRQAVGIALRREAEANTELAACLSKRKKKREGLAA